MSVSLLCTPSLACCSFLWPRESLTSLHRKMQMNTSMCKQGSSLLSHLLCRFLLVDSREIDEGNTKLLTHPTSDTKDYLKWTLMVIIRFYSFLPQCNRKMKTRVLFLCSIKSICIHQLLLFLYPMNRKQNSTEWIIAFLEAMEFLLSNAVNNYTAWKSLIKKTFYYNTGRNWHKLTAMKPRREILN